MDADELTFKYAQENQPWTIEYAERNQYPAGKFRSPFMVNHCVLHITKALGKIARVLEEVDHSNDGPVPLDDGVVVIVNATADIVSSCLKICSIYGYSMAATLMMRVKEKNGVGYR
jgi:hypothetical protein